MSTTASVNEEWEIILNIHPQICLQIGKRYLAVEKDNVTSTRPTQFGRETALTMAPVDGQRGTYTLMGINEKYFAVDAVGNVTATGTDHNNSSSHFVFEFWGNSLAIRSVSTGKYLSAAGSGVKASRAQVGVKEVFILEDSIAQVTLKASNGKYVSYQGANLISVPKMGDKGEGKPDIEKTAQVFQQRFTPPTNEKYKKSSCWISSTANGPSAQFRSSTFPAKNL